MRHPHTSPRLLHLTVCALGLLACKPEPKPVVYSPEESIKQCTVLGGEFASPGFATCLVDRFGWSSDSVVRIVDDSLRAYEIAMAKERAALRDSIAAQVTRDSVKRVASAERARLEAAERQAILDSFEVERARRRLKAMAPKP